MIISLTGFMGCGKSSVGRELSRLLCCPFMDLDTVIEERAGRSIPEIFAEDGEKVFRQMELEALQALTVSETRDLKQSLPSQAMGPSLCGQRGSTVSNPLPPTPNVNKGSLESILILALGGGAVMTKECAEIVREQTLCIYLKASVETLMEHLSGGEAAGRPMLQGDSLRTRIEGLMDLRAETYEKTAHIIIDTDGKSIEEIAGIIKDRI